MKEYKYWRQRSKSSCRRNSKAKISSDSWTPVESSVRRYRKIRSILPLNSRKKKGSTNRLNTTFLVEKRRYPV
jgi:hypothetical protein